MINDLISLKTILEHEDVYLHNAEEEIKMLNEYLKKQKQRRRKAFRRNPHMGRYLHQHPFQAGGGE